MSSSAKENETQPFHLDAGELPDPKPYDGPCFNALDYKGPRYAEAKTLQEAIEMRGADAFFEQVCADDFMQNNQEIGVMLGFADFWAQSTWSKAMPDTRDVEQEQVANSLNEGDLLEIKRCSSDVSDWEMAVYTMDGRLLPYDPFHDYDYAALNRWLDELDLGERLLCQVKKVTCYGEDGVRPDPDFCWRIYSCSTRVFRVTQSFNPQKN